MTGPTTVDLASRDTLENSTVLGISTTSVQAGNKGLVLLLGIIDASSFTWAEGVYLYLAADGRLTATAPNGVDNVGEHLVKIGYSLGGGSVFINIEEPLLIV